MNPTTPLTAIGNGAKRSRLASMGAGLFAFIGGARSYVGRSAGIYRLTDWANTGIPIKVNSAVIAMLSGAGLVAAVVSHPRRWIVRCLGALVAIAGGLTLIEHLTGWNLGIDLLLFSEPPGARATVAPGRMGPPAATSFLAIGIALTLLTGRGRARSVSVALGLAVLCIGTLSLIGYLYGAEEMYAIPQLTGIAFQSAVMLAVLALGLVAACPEREPMRTLIDDTSAGVLARRLLPIMMALPLALGWLRVRGQQAGLYDTSFGSAMRSTVETALLGVILWWGVRALRMRDAQKEKTQDLLLGSEQRLARTLESISDGFVTFDRQGRFIYVNAEAERLLGRPRQELLDQVVWEAFPQAIGGELLAEVRRSATERVMIEVEGPHLVNDGRTFVSRLYPGTDDMVSMYFHDITQRKQIENALHEADRRKDEFLATLAHELRNPLAPIRSAAKLLSTEGVPPSAATAGVQIIDRQARHMSRLLEDLLDVSRISRNRLELRIERVDLATVVNSALEASRPLIDSAGHQISVHLPSAPVFLDGDPVRLAQVFSNLLNNAAKYTKPSGNISVSLTTENGEVVARVRDNGIGIDPAVLPRIFDMFAQATPARERSQGGLGIGLSLVKGLIDLHGGRVEASSLGSGKGSEFTVRIPWAAGAQDAPANAEPGLTRSADSRRLLIVDDSHDGADSLAMLLAALGHETRAVYDGASALREAAQFQPDAVFLDIGMPGMNGLEVCRRLRKIPLEVRPRIIALTGWGQDDDRRRTHEAGFDDHLTKPAELPALVALLEAVGGTAKSQAPPNEPITR